MTREGDARGQGGIPEDGVYEAAPLGPRGAEDHNHLLRVHREGPVGEGNKAPQILNPFPINVPSPENSGKQIK